MQNPIRASYTYTYRRTYCTFTCNNIYLQCNTFISLWLLLCCKVLNFALKELFWDNTVLMCLWVYVIRMHTLNGHLYSNGTESMDKICSEVEVIICAIESRYDQETNSSLPKSMGKTDGGKKEQWPDQAHRARTLIEMMKVWEMGH